MSNFYRITCTKIDGNKVSFDLKQLRSDIGEITSDGGLEQYVFSFLIELNNHIIGENAFPEVNNDTHPLKQQLEDWNWMRKGRKIFEAEGYPDVSHYEGEKVTNIFRFGGKTMLLLRPQYEKFYLEAQKHFEALSFNDNGEDKTMEFKVLTPEFLHPLREGMQWESTAYNMWNFA